MAQKRKPPRLYLHCRAGRPATWVVRDGVRMFSTGLHENQEVEAREALAAYAAEAGVSPDDRCWRPSPPRGRNVIYFISCAPADFPIKIGITSSLPSRILALSTALPYALQVLHTFPGRVDDERRLHLAFASSRLEGEWFSRTPGLMAWIEADRRQCRAAARDDGVGR